MTTNNANLTINVTANDDLVVTVAGKAYEFNRNQAKVGMVKQGDVFPFPIFENIRNEIARNGWVGSYVTQTFDGKQAAVIMAGNLEDMQLGKQAMVWFVQDIATTEAEAAQDAKFLGDDGDLSVYEANGKKFVFDNKTCQKGAFIRPDSLGLVLPVAIEFALSKPGRMAVYKYQHHTLMIEVYEAPRVHYGHVDGIWIIEDIATITPTTAAVG